MKDKKGKNVLAHLKVHLLQGRTITHNQAQTMWRTNRLAKYIHLLRTQHGMQITTEMVYEGDDQYAVYSLAKKKKVSRITSREYMNQADPRKINP